MASEGFQCGVRIQGDAPMPCSTRIAPTPANRWVPGCKNPAFLGAAGGDDLGNHLFHRGVPLVENACNNCVRAAYTIAPTTHRRSLQIVDESYSDKTTSLVKYLSLVLISPFQELGEDCSYVDTLWLQLACYDAARHFATILPAIGRRKLRTVCTLRRWAPRSLSRSVAAYAEVDVVHPTRPRPQRLLSHFPERKPLQAARINANICRSIAARNATSL